MKDYEPLIARYSALWIKNPNVENLIGEMKKDGLRQGESMLLLIKSTNLSGYEAKLAIGNSCHWKQNKDTLLKTHEAINRVLQKESCDPFHPI